MPDEMNLDEMKQRLEVRLEALRPKIEEYNRIERTLIAMDPASQVARPRRTSSHAPRGQRLREFVEAVHRHAETGATITTIMQEVDATTQYGYKLAEQAIKEKTITKRGNLLFPKGTSSPPVMAEAPTKAK